MVEEEDDEGIAPGDGEEQQQQQQQQQAAALLVAGARRGAAAGRGGGDAPLSSPSQIWAVLQRQFSPDRHSFDLVRRCYEMVYEGVDDVRPCWIPTKRQIERTNIHRMMKLKGFSSYAELYEWSTHSRETRDDFWMTSQKLVDIQWETRPDGAFDLTSAGSSPSSPRYFPGGTLNITDSCLLRDDDTRPPGDPALVYATEQHPRDVQTMTLSTLTRLSNQIASALLEQTKLGLVRPGDAVAVCMPMTPEAVAIYLGIIRAGCVAVSVADSFSAEEIAVRCRLGRARAAFTQDVIYRGTAAKVLPLYARVVRADAILQQRRQEEEESDDEVKETKSDLGYRDNMRIVVVPGMLHAGPYPKLAQMQRSESGTWNDRDEQGNPVPLHHSVHLREGLDCSWHDFLCGCSDEFVSVKVDSMSPCNILFSSGTTGEPKAIVWSHSTPIKCAVDGYCHQDIGAGDRVAWPTNIGWMMGPWLVFQLINGATIGIFNGVTSTNAFCQFIDAAKISMVGVIPSLVKAWQARNATQDCDWSCVRRFSSTGEASDPVNYLWLMSRVPGFAPVMEYCGGTEIGGSFLSSTMVQPNVPSMFSTPVLGSQLLLLDERSGMPMAAESRYTTAATTTRSRQHDQTTTIISGEVALVPPSVGLSTVLLNRNHFDTYYRGMPKGGTEGELLRRHGDEIQLVRSAHATATPYFRALGRCDDTMNIGGIKVGSVEIEVACNMVEDVQETAAIAVSSGGPNGCGPSNLVIYAVLHEKDSDPVELRKAMQQSIKLHLNPLFGISDVVVIDALPRTASNKVMRRLLRDDYYMRFM
jgi:acetyl-CoA synthetase